MATCQTFRHNCNEPFLSNSKFKFTTFVYFNIKFKFLVNTMSIPLLLAIKRKIISHYPQYPTVNIRCILEKVKDPLHGVN